MELIGFILFLLVWGAIVGGLGRLALPGPDPMSMGADDPIGIGSSLVAGILFKAPLRRRRRDRRLGARRHRRRLPRPPLPRRRHAGPR